MKAWYYFKATINLQMNRFRVIDKKYSAENLIVSEVSNKIFTFRYKQYNLTVLELLGDIGQKSRQLR